MKSLSLARVLPVLEASGGARTELPRVEMLRPELTLVAADPIDFPDPSPFPEAREEPVVDRWQEGYEAGVAIGRAQAQAEIGAQTAAMEHALAAARAQWTAEESDRIMTGVVKALDLLQSEVCAVAERILAQIVESALRERALADFSDAVKILMRDGEAGIVTIHAPADLIGSLQARLGSIPLLEFVPHEAAEVWVRSGATMIEARLGAWRSSIFGGE